MLDTPGHSRETTDKGGSAIGRPRYLEVTRSLNETIGDVSDCKFDEAAKVAEQRLGMSSLTARDAPHTAPFISKSMQDTGTSMHHAGSRLVVMLQNASVTPGMQSMQEINYALHEITPARTRCHAAYSIR